MRLLLAIALTMALSGCNAIVRGSSLSNVPAASGEFFLSTGGTVKRYRTLGFVQIRGYGQEWGGLVDIGDANIDGALKGALVTEALRMGGTGVIHIEFYDENPSTNYERATTGMKTILSGQKIQRKDRYVDVTGEVIQFLE